MNDQGLDVEACHIVVMNDAEMEVMKLLADGLLAAYEDQEIMPPNPTPEQTQTLLNLFQRIQEM